MVHHDHHAYGVVSTAVTAQHAASFNYMTLPLVVESSSMYIDRLAARQRRDGRQVAAAHVVIECNLGIHRVRKLHDRTPCDERVIPLITNAR